RGPQQHRPGALSSAAGAVLLWTAFRTGRAGAVPSAPGLLGAGALLAVGQQGPEPALYFWSAVRSAADPAGSALPLVLTLLGLGTAVGLCGLFLMGLRRLPPAVFPRVAGAALAVLAAGLLARGAAALQDAGLLGTGMGAAPVFDLGPVLPPDRLYGTVVTGVLGPPTAPAALPFALWSLGLLAALALALAPVIRSALLRCRPGPTESG
uniref:hypothetical protein n=1 Tax=Streptomyces clavuligerus TaxID=1901 RepID=UPI0018D01578